MRHEHNGYCEKSAQVSGAGPMPPLYFIPWENARPKYACLHYPSGIPKLYQLPKYDTKISTKEEVWDIQKYIW